MQVKIDKQRTSTIKREAAGKGEARGRIPNSSLLEEMGARDAGVRTLENLKSTPKQPTRELGERIMDRLSVPLPGLKIYEDEGLAELGERAYARGNEIHVAKGEYRPYTEAGQEMLLHEAGHIVQQGAGLAHGDGLLTDTRLEAQADSGFAAPAGFAIPSSAQGAPVQGFLGLGGLRRRIGAGAHALRETAREKGRDIARGVGNIGTVIGYGAGRAADYASEKGRDIARGVGNIGTVIGYGAGRAADYASEKGRDIRPGRRQYRHRRPARAGRGRGRGFRRGQEGVGAR